MIEILITQNKHCDLVQISGRLDSFTAPQLAATFNSIYEDDRYKIVLDLSQLNYISSSGLLVLVNAQKNCKRYNRGEIIIAGTPELIYAAFEMAGFDQLFRFFADSVTAVGIF